MILLAALLMSGQAVPPPQDDIVVTARRMERLKRLRMTTKPDPATGMTRCVFKRRSGDPALDALVCDAVLACSAEASTMADVRTCLAPRIDPLMANGTRWQANPQR